MTEKQPGNGLENTRCDRYSLARPEFQGVTFCRKAGARAAQDVLDEKDARGSLLCAIAFDWGRDEASSFLGQFPEVAAALGRFTHFNLELPR